MNNYLSLEGADMAQLTDRLSHLLHAPVEDQTRLKGHYAISLDWDSRDSPDEVELDARIKQALKGLGLRLTAGKVNAPIVVVDNAFRVPTPD
jgi:uncharacterized protein (TIGR03435 family)